ncbi:MAG: TIGR04086 family membrane protein [Clostridia bacterium]|nr:TIGR04086 family membrane protein [Clostridia bacterium]
MNHPNSPVKARKTEHRKDADAKNGAPLLGHAVKCLPITFGLGLLILLGFSLIAYFMENPLDWILPFGLASAALTAFFGGFVLARMHRHSALLCGLLEGSLTGGVILLLSLFFVKHATAYSTWLSCLIHAGFLLCSVLGAYAGLPRSKDAPLVRRKRRKIT